MFAILAALCFFLRAFHVEVGSVDLVWLGVGFLCLHYVWPVTVPALPTPTRRSPQ